LAFEYIDLGHHLGRFVFEIRLLRGIVLLHIFAGTVLEVEVSQVVIENLFALSQVFETRLLVLLLNVAFGIKDVEENSEEENAAGDDDHSCVSLRILSRMAGNSVARDDAGIDAARSRHLRTRITVAAMPRASTAGGTIQATMLNFVSMGAASTVGPYLS
jgi:hypothetical protein